MRDEYKDYCWEMQDQVLSWDTLSKQQFIERWTGLVAAEFNLVQSDLEAIYDRDNDIHDTEDKLRMMWKYSTALSVSGAPIAFVNGVKLIQNPSAVESWLSLLNYLYNTQWPSQNVEVEGSFV